MTGHVLTGHVLTGPVLTGPVAARLSVAGRGRAAAR
jgi:hypothetical protein